MTIEELEEVRNSEEATKEWDGKFGEVLEPDIIRRLSKCGIRLRSTEDKFTTTTGKYSLKIILSHKAPSDIGGKMQLGHIEAEIKGNWWQCRLGLIDYLYKFEATNCKIPFVTEQPPGLPLQDGCELGVAEPKIF